MTSPRRQNEWEGRRGGTRGRRLWWLVATHFQCAVFESLPRPLGAGPGLVPPGRLIGVPPTANCAGGKAFPLNCHTFCRRFECNLVTPREAGTGHKRGLTPEHLRSWRQCPFSGGSDRAGAECQEAAFSQRQSGWSSGSQGPQSFQFRQMFHRIGGTSCVCA